MVFGSPPYEAQRTYGIDFKLKGQAWVDWMMQGFKEWQRVSRGLVVMVVEGCTHNFRYSATPLLLMADLHRSGAHLRKPPVFVRSGIPGSGGPDWLRNNYEFIVCVSPPGKLPWSCNTAMGKPPKYKPGGGPSYRKVNGDRINAAKARKNPDGIRGEKRGTAPRYRDVAIANPGNVLNIPVGGNRMGHPLAHKNEAPFPEALADFFIRSFCPTEYPVLDPFSGSGTTVAAAVKAGRDAIGIDIRQNMVDLGLERMQSS